MNPNISVVRIVLMGGLYTLGHAWMLRYGVEFWPRTAISMLFIAGTFALVWR